MSAIGDVVQTRIVCVQGDQVSVNVVHWAIVNKVGTGATDAQAALAFDTVYEAQFKALMSNGATYRGTGFKRLYPIPGVEVAEVSNAGVGGVAGDPLPFQVSGLVTKRSATPGRHGHGRLYVPFPGEADNGATGRISAGYDTRLTNLENNLIGPVVAGAGGNTETYAPVIYNRKTHGIIFVLDITHQQTWATQRRRGEHGRPNVLPF